MIKNSSNRESDKCDKIRQLNMESAETIIQSAQARYNFECKYTLAKERVIYVFKLDSGEKLQFQSDYENIYKRVETLFALVGKINSLKK